MDKRKSVTLRYLLAAGIGAIVGGSIVLVTSETIPRMMSRLMSGMMKSMMSSMGEEACDPADL